MGNRKLSRDDDPDTSRAAARQASRVRTDAHVGRTLLRTLVARYGDGKPCKYTDAEYMELVAMLCWSADRVRHGRLWLVDNGYLEDTGIRRPTGLGGTGRVWKLTAKGRRATIQ